MDETQSIVVACIRDGMTIDQAANQAGRPIGTIRRWLTTGRKYPNGKYGAFARSVDGFRLAVPEQESGDRLGEVDAIAESTGNLDDGVRARLGLARGLARKLDWCEATPTGAAAMAMANLARQYREVLDELQPMRSSTDTDRLVAALWSGQHEGTFRRVLEAIVDGKLKDQAAVSAARSVLESAKHEDKHVAEHGIFGARPGGAE